MSAIIEQFAATTRDTPVVNRLARLAKQLRDWWFPEPQVLGHRPCDESRLSTGFFGPVGEITLDGLAAGWQSHHRQQQLRLQSCGCPD